MLFAFGSLLVAFKVLAPACMPRLLRTGVEATGALLAPISKRMARSRPKYSTASAASARRALAAIAIHSLGPRPKNHIWFNT